MQEDVTILYLDYKALNGRLFLLVGEATSKHGMRMMIQRSGTRLDNNTTPLILRVKCQSVSKAR